MLGMIKKHSLAKFHYLMWFHFATVCMSFKRELQALCAHSGMFLNTPTPAAHVLLARKSKVPAAGCCWICLLPASLQSMSILLVTEPHVTHLHCRDYCHFLCTEVKEGERSFWCRWCLYFVHRLSLVAEASRGWQITCAMKLSVLAQCTPLLNHASTAVLKRFCAGWSFATMSRLMFSWGLLSDLPLGWDIAHQCSVAPIPVSKCLPNIVGHTVWFWKRLLLDEKLALGCVDITEIFIFIFIFLPIYLQECNWASKGQNVQEREI